MSGWKRKRLEALDNENINDVHLVGTDGEELPCCKAFLAAITPVFESMFYRGFKEQTSDRCSLEFHSLVISVIVKYCYCIFSKNKSPEEEATLLVELREAGRFFEIQDLSSTAEAKIANLVFQNNDKTKYQYASAFLTELYKRDEEGEPLGLLLFEFAVEYTMECFGPRAPVNNNGADTYPHPNVLSDVLENTEDIYAAVKCIQTWFSLASNSAGNSYSDEEQQVLIDAAEDIDLKKLSTTQLSEITPCSLFPSERILEALVHHLKSREIISETPRTEPIIHVSGARMEYLNGPYERCYKNGKHTGEREKTIFFRIVEHNGSSCSALIHREHAENKWFISITKTKALLILKNDGSVHEDSIQLHVYEATCQFLPTDDTMVPPFNGWKGINGTDGVPCVARIDRKERETGGN